LVPYKWHLPRVKTPAETCCAWHLQCHYQWRIKEVVINERQKNWRNWK
jgi:hypothetical protein